MKNRKRIGCVLWLVWLVSSACGRNSDIYLEEYRENTQETATTVTENGTQAGMSDGEFEEPEEHNVICYVYICGAVERPGVYALSEGSRIYEVIQEAGGLTEEADDTFVNQAERVTDGMMIRIYTRDEVENLETEYGNATSDSAVEDDRLDINTASVSELMTLPGIGSAKAEAIVSYRETHGEFSCIEDLMKIPGIKEGIFQQMKEHIKVNN